MARKDGLSRLILRSLDPFGQLKGTVQGRKDGHFLALRLQFGETSPTHMAIGPGLNGLKFQMDCSAGLVQQRLCGGSASLYHPPLAFFPALLHSLLVYAAPHQSLIRYIANS